MGLQASGLIARLTIRRASVLATHLTKSKTMAEPSCDLGLIGLAVMGQNLVLNMNDHGFKISVFNRTVAKVDKFIENEAKGTEVVGTHSIEELCATLKKPRRVMLLVMAGKPVDDFIEVGIPVTLIGEAVFARCLSALKGEREHASTILEGPVPTPIEMDAAKKAECIENIRLALYASKIVSYAQGFMLMREEAKQQGWTLNYGGVALMWRGDASSVAVSSATSKRRTRRTPSWRTCCSMTSSEQKSPSAKLHGARLWACVSRMVSLAQPFFYSARFL